MRTYIYFNLDKSSFTYDSCNDLKEAGIYINSKYRLNQNSKLVKCNLWGKYMQLLNIKFVCFLLTSKNFFSD